jgi:hypothetical protein
MSLYYAELNSSGVSFCLVHGFMLRRGACAMAILAMPGHGQDARGTPLDLFRFFRHA